MKQTKMKLNRQQTAEKLRGVPIVQLDYYTGEYVGEYPSMTAAEIDHDLSVLAVVSAFNPKGQKCGVGVLHKHELMFIRKSVYNEMRGIIE